MTGAWTLGSYLFLGIVPLGVHVLQMIVSPTLAARGIIFPEDAAAADRARVGGKAAGLARLRDAGCDVPAWFVVTPACGDDEAVLDALARLVAGDAHATTFAVRSSALVEDGAGASFAGSLRAGCSCRRAAVREAIAHVRASAGGDAARAYARNSDAAPMAVVVQRMWKAKPAASPSGSIRSTAATSWS